MINKKHEIFFFGLNLSNSDARRLFRSGDIKRIARGIYVKASEDENKVIHEHSLRIASYLFPGSSLSNISAQTNGVPVPHRGERGVTHAIYLKGNRLKEFRVGNIVFYHRKDNFKNREVEIIWDHDEIGQFSYPKSSTRSLLLESEETGKRYHYALTKEQKDHLEAVFVASFGNNAVKAHQNILSFAEENGVLYLLDSMRKSGFLEAEETLGLAEYSAPAKVHTFNLRWNELDAGSLSYDEYVWKHEPSPGWILPLGLNSETRRMLPAFVENLLPESPFSSGNKQDDALKAIKNGKRYLSNIKISEIGQEHSPVFDRLHGLIADFTDEKGVFISQKTIPESLPEPDGMYEVNVAKMNINKQTTRISGVQMKTPVFLDEKGNLQSASGRPFTHILKLPGRDSMRSVPLREWLGMRGAKETGAKVAENALVNLGEWGFPGPGFICERFDVPQNEEDKRLIMSEDVASVMGLSSESKYKTTLIDAWDKMKVFSTHLESDKEQFFRQALSSWLVGNGDLHIKNISLIKSIDHPEQTKEETWSSVSMAPGYDVVFTSGIIVGTNQLDSSLALPLTSEDKANEHNWILFAKKIGISKIRAENIIEESTKKLSTFAKGIQNKIPDFVKNDATLNGVVLDFQKIVVQRCATLQRERAKENSSPMKRKC